MKKSLALFLSLLSVLAYPFWSHASYGPLQVEVLGGETDVEWYERSNGTYVNGYTRSNPNNYTVDNRTCLENLNRCFEGLDQEDFDKVLSIIREMDEIRESWGSVREDIMNQYPWILRAQLDTLVWQRQQATLRLYESKLQSLNMYKLKAEDAKNQARIEERIQSVSNNSIDDFRKTYNSSEYAGVFKKAYNAYELWNYSDAVRLYEYYLNMDGVSSDVNYQNGKLNLDLAKKQVEKQLESQILSNLVKAEKENLPREIEISKIGLWGKSKAIESLVPIIKSKDSETQQKISLILETFKASKDDYTRSVWIYLSYLLK